MSKTPQPLGFWWKICVSLSVQRPKIRYGLCVGFGSKTYAYTLPTFISFTLTINSKCLISKYENGF